MEDLSLHILDIAENSINAGAKTIKIFICENGAKDLLTVTISDDGKGMSEEVTRKATDPFYTTRTTRRVGLGLSLLEAAAKATGGSFSVQSKKGVGTEVCATFQLTHIDRKPLGKIPDTITAIIAGRPDVDIIYTHERNGGKFVFRTEDVREQLGCEPVNSVGTLSFIKKYLTQEENNLSH
jgi:anti-sigma regulatory factor (Ser/Thr protein kinase)